MTVVHSNASQVVADHLDNVTVHCNFGYEAMPGVDFYITQCLENQTWSETKICSRKYIKFN